MSITFFILFTVHILQFVSGGDSFAVVINPSNNVTRFNTTRFFEQVGDIDRFGKSRFLMGLSGTTEHQFQCVDGDACTSPRANRINLACRGQPYPPLIELRCTYVGKGLRMENLSIQCMQATYYSEGSDRGEPGVSAMHRRCAATYDLWKSADYSVTDEWLFSYGLAWAREYTVRGVMMPLIYAYRNGHFDPVVWEEIVRSDETGGRMDLDQFYERIATGGPFGSDVFGGEFKFVPSRKRRSSLTLYPSDEDGIYDDYD